MSNKLFQPFPWYDDPLLRNHKKEQCKEDCWFQLLTPQYHMLPFQIRRPKSNLPISGLAWTCPDGSNSFILNPDVFQIYTAGEYDYITYDGRELAPCVDCDPDAAWPCKYLVAVMTDGINTWYSEVFYIEPLGSVDPFEIDEEHLLTDENGVVITAENGDPIVL